MVINVSSSLAIADGINILLWLFVYATIAYMTFGIAWLVKRKIETP